MSKMKPRQLGASGYVLDHSMKEVFTLTHNGMKQIPTAEEFMLSNRISNPIGETFRLNLSRDCHVKTEKDIQQAMIEFAKLHVEALMKEMEQKLLDTLDDMNYLEENVCGVIEEIRKYKPDNIK